MCSGRRHPSPRSAWWLGRYQRDVHHTIRAGLPMLLKGYELQFDLFHRRLKWCADTNRCIWASGGLYPPRLNHKRPRLSLHLQVLVPRYHFRARLRLPPTRHLQRYQSPSRLVWQISFCRTFEVTCMDLAIIGKVW